jgi:hypothetical protein
MAAGTDIERGKARGWVTIAAGIFIVVLMSGVWIFVMKAVADHRLLVKTPENAAFLGRTYVAFALIVLCGFLGILNGVIQLRTGRRNLPLNALILILVGAALVTIWIGTSSNRS